MADAMPYPSSSWRAAVGLGACLCVLSGAVSAAGLGERLHAAWSNPRAVEFAAASARIAPAVQAVCDASGESAEPALALARQRWLGALTSWERLSGVAFGTLLERRLQRQIDFTPTRPRLIAKAVKAAPAGAADMELIGTPAKGLPALEWLLWVNPIQPGSPACRYAVQVAAEIEREAKSLAAAPAPGVDDQTALSELVNQWIGGLERLRWANMEMPARVALTSNGRDMPDFPRRHAGASAASWAAEWAALRGLATGAVSLEATLRERGKSAAADAFTQAIRQTDAAMQGLGVDDTSRLLVVAKQLAALKRVVEDVVAPALGVNIGFSDADGD